MSKTSSRIRNFSKRLLGITMPIQRKRAKWGRNWLCICGSGLKYKNCCIGDIQSLKELDNNDKVTPIPKDIQMMIEEHKKAEEERAKQKKSNGEKSNG